MGWGGVDHAFGAGSQIHLAAFKQAVQGFAELAHRAFRCNRLGLSDYHFLERLTKDMEEEAFDYLKTIDDMGGMVAAIERNYPQMEIADAAYAYQAQVDSKEKTVVGVNKYATEEAIPVDILHIAPELEAQQIERTTRVKERREREAATATLERLGEAAQGTDNLMPFILDAVNAHATEQEICDVLRQVFGVYRDPGVY